MVIMIITLCFIMFDIVTGITKACYNKSLNSTLLREGLFHKLSEVLAIVGSWLLGYSVDYIHLGIDLPIVPVVGIYICIMELISIMENLATVNPTLEKLFKPYFEKLKDEENEK